FADFAAQILPCEVWKLHVRFCHDQQADYAGDQTHTLRGVPVPKVGKTAPFPAAFVLQGVTLRFTGITWRPDVIGARNGVLRYSAKRRPAVEFEAQGPGYDHLLTLRATDARGHRVSEATLDGTSPVGEGKHMQYLDLPAGLRKVNLTFTL